MLDRKPRVEPLEVHEAAEHQSSSSEQHDSQRQLGDDHRPAEPARAAVTGRAAAAFLQDFVVVRLRHVERRREAEENGGQAANPGDVSEHDVVDTEIDPVRLPGIADRGIERLNAEVGQQQAEASADERQRQALDQQLADYAPTRRAERRANSNLPGPSRRPR